MTALLSAKWLIVPALLAGLLDAPGRVLATVAVAPPVQAARTGPHVAPLVVTRVVPLSASGVIDGPAMPPTTSDFVHPAARPAPLRHMAATPVLGGFSIFEIAVIGTVLVALTSYARRRHRRRLAWGFLSDRSFCRLRSSG